MESSKTTSYGTVTKVAKSLIPLLGAAYICFLLITALAKPVYRPMGALLIIMGGTALTAAICAILLILDHMGEEVE
jgi:hypothetical protein